MSDGRRKERGREGEKGGGKEGERDGGRKLIKSLTYEICRFQ